MILKFMLVRLEILKVGQDSTSMRIQKSKHFWEEFSESDNSSMYVIGHELFNKSLTLDIENRLMQYLLSVDNISMVHNSRTNQQNEYYTSEKLDEIFSNIWQSLHKKEWGFIPN